MAIWIIRCGNGDNLWNAKSRGYTLWAINSKKAGKSILTDARTGDTLVFVRKRDLKTGEGNRQAIAFATFVRHAERILGPLIAASPTNEDLGWTEGEWDTEIHYRDLYDIRDCGITLDGLQTAATIMRYQKGGQVTVDLEKEYDNVCRYSKAKRV